MSPVQPESTGRNRLNRVLRSAGTAVGVLFMLFVVFPLIGRALDLVLLQAPLALIGLLPDTLGGAVESVAVFFGLLILAWTFVIFVLAMVVRPVLEWWQDSRGGASE